MENRMKLAAEKLYKLADELEKSAFENTYFVCNRCNHTASLADINAKRKYGGTALMLAEKSLWLSMVLSLQGLTHLKK